MATEHEGIKRVETINENLTITITPKWEGEYTWEVISLNDGNHEIEIGSYFTDGVAGLRQWIEYNGQSIIIFGEDRYTGATYIDKAYDIQTNDFVLGNQDELTKYYMSTFQEAAKTKNLTCLKKSLKK